MSANRKTVVGVIFGGRSVEHDVSVVTGNQVMRAFDPERYEVVPVYIDREGRWFTGTPLLDLKNYRDEVISMSGVSSAIISPDVRHHGLIVNPTAGRFSKSEVMRLDTVFPAIHGSHGEDGTLQGLLELADIPYVGCGVLASALANDKITTKTILRQRGIPVVDSVDFTRAEWYADPDAIMRRIAQTLAYPMFVKPATIGSSIGITRPANEVMLRASIDIAASFDRRLLVESAVTESIEINCALMGDDRDVRASVLEQPVSWEEFLTYEDKYLRGGEGMKSADRIIPAPLTPELTQTIKNIAIDAFRAIDGRGTTRIDFLVRPDKGEVFLNELNSMPGSVAFYLWQEDGLTARDVVQRLVDLAREAQAEKRQTTYNYRTRLLEQAALRGVKGAKGGKGPARSQS
ncbi:MAG: D-alanine--D-alanine ligase [Burkholderiales bacterium]|nr:D-alanine--D-alanine ligase [Anaerolineae bacterium]